MLTQERLRELLDYNPGTGIFFWKTRPSRSIRIGQMAGSITFEGYVKIRIDRKYYQAHRLAWFYVYGKFPNIDIDHIDRDRLNNRIVNLRLATKAQNRANRINSKNSSGFVGVQKRGRKWIATIKQKHLGTFDTPELASEAYRFEAIKLYGEFAALDLRKESAK